MASSGEEWLGLLRTDDPDRNADLFRRADGVREAFLGDAVHLRGLIEIGNVCVRACAYCGLRAARGGLARYRMSAEAVMGRARIAARLGIGTVVLQAGEDPGLSREWVGDLVRALRRDLDLAVTLSLGERDEADLRHWRACGADRYLLRFETSDPVLFRRIHPSLPGRPSDRIGMLRLLRTLGYETGGGIMVGLPGQTWASIARDLEVFRELDLDMIGIGPYRADPATPLGRGARATTDPGPDQVPASGAAARRVVALARIVRPDANIPATTAASLAESAGFEAALRAGANVIMPNLTPLRYQALYAVYPRPPLRSARAAWERALRAIAAAGRIPGRGRGDRRENRDPCAGPGGLLPVPSGEFDRRSGRPQPAGSP